MKVHAFSVCCCVPNAVLAGPLRATAYHANPTLCALLLQVVGATAGALVQHVAAGCWEEGALLAGLWNLHTGLMDAGLAASRSAAEAAQEEAKQLRETVRRCVEINAGRSFLHPAPQVRMDGRWLPVACMDSMPRVRFVPACALQLT